MLITTRLLALCVLCLAAVVSVGGCATGGRSAPQALVSEDVTVPSADAGISIFMRNKVPAEMRAFSAEKTVLFVHGTTYSSEATFGRKPPKSR